MVMVLPSLSRLVGRQLDALACFETFGLKVGAGMELAVGGGNTKGLALKGLTFAGALYEALKGDPAAGILAGLVLAGAPSSALASLAGFDEEAVISSLRDWTCFRASCAEE